MNNKIKILFICHGNICRSPMAEFVMKKIVRDEGLSDNFYIYSMATSTEELGNGPYPPAKRKMQEMNVPMEKHHSSQISAADYNKYDYLIGMDSANIRNMTRIFTPAMSDNEIENKIFRLKDFSVGGDIADPWYTDDFDTTYNEVLEGCLGLLKHLKEKFDL